MSDEISPAAEVPAEVPADVAPPAEEAEDNRQGGVVPLEGLLQCRGGQVAGWAVGQVLAGPEVPELLPQPVGGPVPAAPLHRPPVGPGEVVQQLLDLPA